jgi:hypothetical protein
MAETMELQTFRNELMRTDIAPAELQKLAEKKSVEIFQKIKASAERIAEAKELAEEAKNAKGSKAGTIAGAVFFGIPGLIFARKNSARAKKLDLTTDGLLKTNEAIAEMNNLIQESIGFTCVSIQVAQIMHKTMTNMMVNGFRDTDGQITRLSSECKEAVQSILDEADDFVKKQRAVEEAQAEMHGRLHEQEKKQAEMYRRLDEYTKQKDLLDKEQSESIQKITEALKAGDNYKKMMLAFSIAALAVSIGTLVFFICSGI